MTMCDEYFEIGKQDRIDLINKHIISNLPEEEKNFMTRRVVYIVDKYEGQDLNALSVLIYAAEKGGLEEYIQKLEKHFGENLAWVHPKARKFKVIPGAVRAEMFFLQCYEQLGVKPKDDCKKVD